MVFNPSGDRRCRIQQLARSTPDNGDRNSVRSRCFCAQSAIVNVRWSLVTATMRSGHFHLTALVVHHPAAGALLGGQLRAGEHTGHCRCQACRQQQDQYPELAQYSHSSPAYLNPETQCQGTTQTSVRRRARSQEQPRALTSVPFVLRSGSTHLR